MKLYGVYGVNDLNTSFNVTYTKGRRILDCEKTWSKQTEVWVTLFVEKTSLDTVRCKTSNPFGDGKKNLATMRGAVKGVV